MISNVLIGAKSSPVQQFLFGEIILDEREGRAIYSKNLLFPLFPHYLFFSPYFVIFSEYHGRWQGKWITQVREVWHRWMEWKMPLCKWHVNLLLYCHIIIYWEEVTFYEKFSHNLTPEVKIIWKISAIQSYWWIVLIQINRWIFKKFQLKWNISKYFTRSEQRVSLITLFSLLQDKSFLYLWSENFLTEIYRSIPTFAFRVLWECISWMFRNGAVEMCFLTYTRNRFAGKFVNWVRFVENIIYNIS